MIMGVEGGSPLRDSASYLSAKGLFVIRQINSRFSMVLSLVNRGPKTESLEDISRPSPTANRSAITMNDSVGRMLAVNSVYPLGFFRMPRISEYKALKAAVADSMSVIAIDFTT
jgi:hypothetical protein